MRIAYITPYQGPTLLKRRPVNRTMSNTVKIELIATLLHAKGHDVEVFSYGEISRVGLGYFYPAFREAEPFHPQIPVYYISALPIRGLYGVWGKLRMVELLNRRHHESPFDVVIIFNFKPPQIASARYARRHRIPFILEYEDDVFRTVPGDRQTIFVTSHQKRTFRRVLDSVAGCIAVSPYLISQAPAAVPSLLLRGVVGDDILDVSERLRGSKRNIVLFSGTHNKVNGVEELIAAWGEMKLPEWSLHITGLGELTESIRKEAEGKSGIVFHGLVSRQGLVELMGSAKICVSPQRLSDTLGDQFPFKVIEYLAAGAHVAMTPMGKLEREIEEGITYMADNRPETIAATLRRVIDEQLYIRTADSFVQRQYGTHAVSEALNRLLDNVVGRSPVKQESVVSSTV